jgi:MinD superfamily P-loop ATPase
VSPAIQRTIAVASGKGGTGKTTVAAHLALAASRSRNTILVDLDVEAPDSRGYFPDSEAIGPREAVLVSVPRFTGTGCTGCRTCAASCHFGAIIAIGRTVTVNDKLCKGCGRCVAACPAGALAETEVEVGATSLFRSGALDLLEGRMAIGDIRSTAVIEAAKRRASRAGAELQVRDCPPGVSCPATHAIEGADYVILVAEPTEFSRHDLEAALRLVSGRGMQAGVVINKDGFGTADVAELCGRYGIPVIGRLAFTRERAASGAAAKLWADDPELMGGMEGILAAAMAAAPQPAGGER